MNGARRETIDDGTRADEMRTDNSLSAVAVWQVTKHWQSTPNTSLDLDPLIYILEQQNIARQLGGDFEGVYSLHHSIKTRRSARAAHFNSSPLNTRFLPMLPLRYLYRERENTSRRTIDGGVCFGGESGNERKNRFAERAHGAMMNEKAEGITRNRTLACGISRPSSVVITRN